MLYFRLLTERSKRWEEHVPTTCSCRLPLFIFQNDEVRFLVTEKLLQGEPFNRAAQQRSPSSIYRGKAWLSATNDPRYGGSEDFDGPGVGRRFGGELGNNKGGRDLEGRRQ